MTKTTLAWISLVFAAVLLGGGLLFLCAASVEPSRLWFAGALLALGIGLAVWGSITLRRQRDLQPARVADRIVALVSRRGDAEITLSDAVGSLHVPNEVAERAMALLIRRQVVERQRRDDREVYLFPGLRESRSVRRCPYCASQFSVKTPVHKCPNCGASLEIAKT